MVSTASILSFPRTCLSSLTYTSIFWGYWTYETLRKTGTISHSCESTTWIRWTRSSYSEWWKYSFCSGKVFSTWAHCCRSVWTAWSSSIYGLHCATHFTRGVNVTSTTISLSSAFCCTSSRSWRPIKTGMALHSTWLTTTRTRWALSWDQTRFTYSSGYSLAYRSCWSSPSYSGRAHQKTWERNSLSIKWCISSFIASICCLAPMISGTSSSIGLMRTSMQWMRSTSSSFCSA